ncbi:MAG TPA: 50S ribosomal protein L34e [Candidatus Nanoarchaeia archaeon]|nr:50S ribosomal protein L34e [Candidatus Nanoarchaeia archaeon]
MPKPQHKSRTLNRIYVRAPKGVRIHYREKKQAKPKCRICGDVLKGVAHGVKTQIRKLSKTKKAPSRPYAGNLCSKCMRSVLLEKAQVMRNG